MSYKNNEIFNSHFSADGNLIANVYQSLLGPMLIIADDYGVHLLEFWTRKNLDKEVDLLKKRFSTTIALGSNWVTKIIKLELDEYFTIGLNKFKAPIHIHGTIFEKAVWKELVIISYGKTISYFDQAVILKNPKAARAVANANGKNKIAIIIPCHRIINKNGALGGYGAGLEIKKWLLNHEQTT